MVRDRGNGQAFIGSFTSSGGHGIIAAEVDDETGALTVQGTTDVVADPSYLALAPDGSVLYTVSETEEGAAAAFRIPAPGAPDQALLLMGRPVAVSGSSPTHLALASGHLLTANYGSGSVTALPLRSDGGLDAPARVFRHQGSGPHPDRQCGPHAHQVLTDPSGRWIVSVDLGTDSVRVCALDAASGTLTAHSETALRAGSGPRHLAFHPAGSHAYVLNELEPTLTICRWDARQGVLEAVAETPVLPADAGTDSYASEVVVSHDGRYVWTANRGHDSISVLSLDGTREKAELITTVGCGGRWPRDLALDPAGRRLYAANEHSGDVTWFDIDPRTGIPAPAGAIEVPAASCVIFGRPAAPSSGIRAPEAVTEPYGA
ncbi:lactonase family protein [Streptomyces sp. NPDC088725]|uniref:lactonase family protein n=1 Tax=Streptomyces sp. NPDC088725 TaxID=3365873 RepID=UPI0038190543